MGEIINHKIKLKEKLDKNDYENIKYLQDLCLEVDQTALKLELDYKLERSKRKSTSFSHIDEFMYYDNNKLIGYIGISDFGGDALEVNGMVHPEYRRRGIFRRLFSLVMDEWNKRKSQTILLLSDHNSISGLEFIRNTGADYANSEYEMFLKGNGKTDLLLNNVILRKATNEDAKEIALQNAIYFDIQYKEEDIIMPEEEEKLGLIIYIAEVDNKIIGKVNLENRDELGAIYGLGVLPEYRGRGYGREILTLGIEKLKKQKVKEIMLQVSVKNKNALNLYKSCGFEEASTMDYYEIKKK